MNPFPGRAQWPQKHESPTGGSEFWGEQGHRSRVKGLRFLFLWAASCNSIVARFRTSPRSLSPPFILRIQLDERVDREYSHSAYARGADSHARANAICDYCHRSRTLSVRRSAARATHSVVKARHWLRRLLERPICVHSGCARQIVSGVCSGRHALRRRIWRISQSRRRKPRHLYAMHGRTRVSLRSQR